MRVALVHSVPSQQVAPLTDLHAHTVSQPRRLRAFERRKQLSEVARELFAVHGYHHISMDDIANAAHVTKPVLYKHFPSKLELYLNILWELSNSLVESASCEITDAKSSAPVPANAYLIIKSVFDGYVRFVHDTGTAVNLLLESDITRDPQLRGKLEEPHTIICAQLCAELALVLDVPESDISRQCAAIVSIAKDVAVTMSRCTEEIPVQSRPDIDVLAQFAWLGLSRKFDS